MSTPGSDPTLLEDYAALRRGLGVGPRPRDVVSVTGPEALTYLQGQLSQDVAGLGVGDSSDALVLEPDGKLTALVRVLRVRDDTWWLDTDAGFGEVVTARLGRFKLRTKVEIAAVQADCVALRGPQVPPPEPGPGEGRTVFALPFSWNGAQGVDLLGPEAGTVAPSSARWCGPAAFEALRVEAGIPAMGRELDGRTIAAEAALTGRAVSFTKGCYTGQELIARLDARGNKVVRRLCGFVVSAEAAAAVDPDAGNLLGAEVVTLEDKAVGQITSAAWCPGVGGPAALGYLHRSVEVPGPLTLALAAPDGQGIRLAVEARPLPLVG